MTTETPWRRQTLRAISGPTEPLDWDEILREASGGVRRPTHPWVRHPPISRVPVDPPPLVVVRRIRP
jgi:hypothetical protein